MQDDDCNVSIRFDWCLMHDAHERFFDAFWTPINLADILFCVSDSISVVAYAKSCVKGGISL